MQESEEEADEEEVREKRRQARGTGVKKTAPKRAKTNGPPTTQLAIRPAAKTKAKKPRQAQAAKHQMEGAVGLFGEQTHDLYLHEEANFV